jgi:hypothetical protein
MPPYNGINENIDQILRSVDSRHVTEYDWLVQNIHSVAKADYQKRYKDYWGLDGAGLSQNYCQAYFEYLKAGLNNGAPQLDIIVNRLYQIPVRPDKCAVQFSFCTKLCHMINRHSPIYDRYFRDFYNFEKPSYSVTVKQRIASLIGFHKYLVHEYDRVLQEGLVTKSIQAFRERFKPQYFTDIKVIDSLIWACSPRENGNRMIW